jgi:hypothetical protein
MGLFGRDYDRDYTYDSAYRPSRSGGRSFWGRSGSPIRPNYEDDFGGRYGETGWASSPSRPIRYGRESQPRGYDSFYRGRNEYDRPYKSQWQTDYGDPFGDREQQTPMRVIREESRRSRGGLFRDSYDRDYDTGYPMGYRPYSSRSRYDVGYQPQRRPGNDAGYTQRTYRTYENRYDNDWF